MNPLRSFFLSLAKMPPVVMLFIILGMAVVVTMYVMGAINEREASANGSTDEQRVAIVTVTSIPAGAQIDSDEIIQKEVSKSSIFEDALHDTSTVVGRRALHKIPARQQVRAIDLE